MADRYAPLAERFWAKVAKSDGCWEWTGSRSGADGYGRIRSAGRQLLAHRVAYELEVGPIPGDLTIDHLCANKGCVRPDHMEPVERGENVRRYTRAIASCPAGHVYDEANTYVGKTGKRACRECARTRDRKRVRSHGRVIARLP